MTLCLGAACLATLNATELFDAAMILLDIVGKARVLHTPQAVHAQVIACPIFNVPVWGNDLEDLDEAVAFKVDDALACAEIDLIESLIA